MKFRDLFGEVEDWFWKLEFNPETGLYELYLGIPNDWVYSEKNGLIDIGLIHKLEGNSIVKISSEDESITIDDILETAILLTSKNQELERRKQAHKEEMERLRDVLVEKEKNFLVYIDTVKENTIKSSDDTTESEKNDEGTTEAINEGSIEVVVDEVKTEFLKDIEKVK